MVESTLITKENSGLLEQQNNVVDLNTALLGLHLKKQVEFLNKKSSLETDDL